MYWRHWRPHFFLNIRVNRRMFWLISTKPLICHLKKKQYKEIVWNFVLVLTRLFVTLSLPNPAESSEPSDFDQFWPIFKYFVCRQHILRLGVISHVLWIENFTIFFRPPMRCPLIGNLYFVGKWYNEDLL